MLVLNIIDNLNKWIKPFKDFVFENHDNPLMWIIFFLIGIITFIVVYYKLQREK